MYIKRAMTTKQLTASDLSSTVRSLIWKAWNNDGIGVSRTSRPRGIKRAQQLGLVYFTKAKPTYTEPVPGETGRYMLTRKGLAIGLEMDDAERAA